MAILVQDIYDLENVKLQSIIPINTIFARYDGTFGFK